MIDVLNINLIVLSVIAFANLMMAVAVLWQSDKIRSSIFFGLCALSSSIWVGVGVVRYFAYPSGTWWTHSLFLTKLSLIAAICVFYYFVLFVFSFVKRLKKYRKVVENVSSALTVGIAILIFFTDTILVSEDFSLDFIQPIYNWGSLYLSVYTPILLLFFFYPVVLLLLSYRKITDPLEKKQLRFILYGSAVAGFFGTGFGLIVAFFPGLAELFWIGRLSTMFFVGFVTYAILKHNVFNIKLFATQILVFLMWVFFLIRAFTTEGVESLINWSLLALLIVLGILLMRSISREIEQRTRVETLAKDLAKANEKLKTLDEQKSEFLSIASHQFRGPLTSIKGYTSLILEGTYGKVPKKLQEPIERVFTSSSNLALIVDDFLNVSRIDQGRMKYEFDTYDMQQTIKESIDALEANADRKGVKIKYEYDKADTFMASIDKGKFLQVINNLIDNAIKYTPKGHITVRLKKIKEGKKLRIEVQDTGVGIPPDNLDHVFERFTRARNANSANVVGSGLGLYIVKQIIEAHKDAKIWVESPGEGKGSLFIVEMPASK